ncbi:hypothetical protein SCHPADRAFT_898627 [Schizopora paradoxa]|uniref:Uncharacterized protein n=1 Tax=Schizopora paradoxa TaxID=27342 RepID=A0A0H2SD54_9AGAM|nr:hypothetical protein SCHPADRAFT_898627 [Schizopora paradoxa]
MDVDESYGGFGRDVKQGREESAMDRLPTELLNEIFSWSMPVIPSFRAIDGPLLLTAVCGRWRECALSQSDLWDTIYLPSPLDGISAGVVQLCKLWLERSRNRPLSIDFHLSSDYQPWKISNKHIQDVDKIVKLLVPHAYRISKLLRISPRFLLGDLLLENMTVLDDLFLCDTADEWNGRVHVSHGSLKVPDTLRCLSLRQTFFDLKAFSSFNRLAHLDLWQLQGEGSMSIGSCLQVLRRMPWLESCTMDVAQGDCAIDLMGTEIVMQNLSFLFISWDWLVDVGPILDAVSTPVLRRLGLRGPPPSAQEWPHLSRFIRRCKPQLTQLSLKEIGFTDIHLLDCLKHLPTLTNLSISHCSVDTAFIRTLRLDGNLPLRSNVLPYLEFLSLEACDNFDVGDLAVMLNSRGKGVPSYAQKLRGIRLSLCRRIMEARRVELENSGVENVIIKVAKPTSRATPYTL